MAAPVSGPVGIFISYRRVDAAYPTGWLFDSLTAHFGPRVFKDVDSIQLGDDFVEKITSAVESCAVLLAVIGKQWLTATNEDGQRRLEDPTDFVRLEIEAALTREILVIPVLVDGARMPRATELPPGMGELARRQALELTPHRFKADTGRLLKVLDPILTKTTQASAPAADKSTNRGLRTDQQNAAPGPTSSSASNVAARDPQAAPRLSARSENAPRPESRRHRRESDASRKPTSPPRLLGGRYELDGVVGRGGRVEVYRAHDIRRDRIVAVKALRADLARDQKYQTNFRRTTQLQAMLNYPSIVAVYDTGEDMTTGVPVPYIVMEYVDGRTVRDLLQEGHRLLPERSLEIIDGVLRALDYSHRAGIVHRDIKPSHVMVSRNGDLKVMGFGIALSMSDAQATMTQKAQVIGTAQYLSPEQARGERVDSRSDLYSTGCLLYELLTGRPPFTGDSPVAIAYQHVRVDPVPPSRVDPEVPLWGDAIVLKAMAKAPADRYQTAADMRADLQRAASGMPVAAAPSAKADGYSTPGKPRPREVP